MPFIGNDPSPAFESLPTRQEFSGDGSTTTFTLNQTVSSEQEIVVSVDGVVQEPPGAYTVPDGTTLTFSAAPSSNSGNNIFVMFLVELLGLLLQPQKTKVTLNLVVCLGLTHKV